MGANGSVRFAKYCGKMYSCNIFPYGGLKQLHSHFAKGLLLSLIYDLQDKESMPLFVNLEVPILGT